MSDQLDFTRFSDLVGAVVDRRNRSVAIGITSASGFLRGLVTQSQSYANDALTQSNRARDFATQADTSASTAQIVYNNITSIYGGVQDNDPTRSSQGNSFTPSAFYIRRSDGRLRFAASIAANGNPVWADATVQADTSSIATAGIGIFLLVNNSGLQNVAGPVNFNQLVTGQRVSSWTSQQFTTAVDVNEKLAQAAQSLTNEVTRATAAEASILSSRVSKSGDIINGALQINAPDEVASLYLNNTSTNGRSFRIHSSGTALFRIVDNTANAERMTLDGAGNFTFRGNVTSTSAMVSPLMAVNRTDGNDSTALFQTNGLARWSLGRSVSSSRFYIGRYNAQGAFIDAPITINESDGAITLGRTNVNDALSARGYISVSGAGGALLSVNNSSGNTDSVLQFQHAGVTRWVLGRSFLGASLYTNRYNDSGAYIDSPFYIAESNGTTVMTAVQVMGSLSANANISANVLYARQNSNGRAIAVGDDAWIGDNDIANGFSIRGQADFNAGFVRFGNAGATLGCNPNDGTLRYGGQEVLNRANLNIGQYFGYYENGNGRATVNPIGIIEQWNVVQQSISEGAYSVNFPIAFADVNSINIQVTVLNVNGDNRFDIWAQVRSWTTTGCVIYIQYPGGGGNINAANGFMWRAIGR